MPQICFYFFFKIFFSIWMMEEMYKLAGWLYFGMHPNITLYKLQVFSFFLFLFFFLFSFGKCICFWINPIINKANLSSLAMWYIFYCWYLLLPHHACRLRNDHYEVLFECGDFEFFAFSLFLFFGTVVFPILYKQWLSY